MQKIASAFRPLSPLESKNSKSKIWPLRSRICLKNGTFVEKIAKCCCNRTDLVLYLFFPFWPLWHFRLMNCESAAFFHLKHFDIRLDKSHHFTMGIFASEKCINKELQNSKNREKESNLTLFLGRKSLKNRKNDE